MIKTCRTCKHSAWNKLPESGTYYLKFNTPCLRIDESVIEEVDVVTGDVKRTYPKYCCVERDEYYRVDGRDICGPEGKYWEPI